MILVLAGKSNALVECIKFSLKVVDKNTIRVIPVKSDNETNDWQCSIVKYCRINNIKIITLEESYELESMVFVSIQYDRILKPHLFKTNKIYNIHFSYLPFYKGVFPIVWPILNQEKFTGVTLHQIDSGIDTGDVIDKRKVFLNDDTTSRDLYFECQKTAYKIFKKNLKSLIDNTAILKKQPNHIGSYYSKTSLNLSDFKIDLNKTASQISAQIRALAFPEYQLPELFGEKIYKVVISDERSNLKPGEIISQDKECIKIATIDYDICLHIDYRQRLFDDLNKGDIESMKKTLSNIKDINITNSNSCSPIMVAAYNGDLPAIKLLVKAGADVNAQNQKGTSVLMYSKSFASTSGNLEGLKYLIENGALINHKDKYNKSLLAYAHDEGNSVVIQFLESKIKFVKKTNEK